MIKGLPTRISMAGAGRNTNEKSVKHLYTIHLLIRFFTFSELLSLPFEQPFLFFLSNVNSPLY